MKGGHDETSYAKNSALQKKGSDMVKHITLETIQKVYSRTTPENLTIADFGCSTGPNTLSMIKDLYHAVEDTYRNTLINGPKSSPSTITKLSSVSVYLNDLPTNDFNSIFRALPDFYKDEVFTREGHFRPSLFVAASPGSFYGPIFPPNFLHFVHSSYSLHWLSKIPPDIYDEQGKSMNKGCIYICESSPPRIITAYAQQFREDFSRFLRHRSQELKKGGSMVLVFLGREGLVHFDRGNSFIWELLARSFRILVSKGEIEEEKLNAYDVHFFAPSKEEVVEEVKKEGSFEVVGFEMFQVEREDEDRVSYGIAVASTIRAIQESMISHHFGEHILDSLFDTYAQLVDEEMSKQEIRPINFLLVLSKI